MRQKYPVEALAPRLTIGRLARAANVGVETIRYYQGRGLLPVPRPTGAVRYYTASLIDRIGFIKRAQSLGFSLNEVASLLDLQDGRNRRAIQAVAMARLAQIRGKLTDLRRMRQTLDELLKRCQSTGEAPACPIIEMLMGVDDSVVMVRHKATGSRLKKPPAASEASPPP